MRRWLVLGAVAFLATIGWLALRDILRGYWSTRGAHVEPFTLRSKLLHRKLDEVLGFARSHSPYRAPVWLDVGTEDPFLQADTALAHELRADGTRLTFHIWPGVHGSSYWHRHIGQYLRFYADACSYSSKRRTTIVALWPPKPNEFETAVRTSASRASFGM